ncbi:hypothetical protein [Flavonifractor plautii]|uniref:hypothetical protein n=1 Tax=Flavonifractor plautii TaxID=292800 RepID=UPI003AAB60CD
MRPRTHRTYEGYLRLYIKPRLGDIPLNKLTENDKQQICVWMKPDEHANGKGIADSQIRCCRSLCRQTLEKAVEEHLILCNPAIGCKCLPAKREEMKFPQGKLCREYSSRPKRKITMNSSFWSLPLACD